MAILLTKNWQRVAEAYLGNTGYGDVYVRCYAKYSSQSIEENKTTVNVETRIYCSRGNFISASGTTASATIDGDTNSNSANSSYSGEITASNKTKDVTHNQDGSKTINVSSGWSSEPWGWSNTASANVDLPKIDRYPMIITAPDFSDEDSPTMTYTTTLGFEGATVEAGIFDSTGTTAYASYREINVENGSYTFSLTTEERNALRNATPNSNTMNVMFKIRTTTTNSVEYFSTSVKQLRIVNADPTMTYTITETNQKVIDLLGTSANTIIENVSQLNFNVVPTTYKSATVQRVLCGNRYDINNRISKYESPYSIDIPVKSENTFIVVVYDSRYNIVQDTDIEKTMIEYQPVDITNLSMKRVNPTSSNIILNLEAKYYQKTFGSTANVPIVKWKLDDGSYTTIPSSAYTIDTTNNKLTISNYTLSNVLPYTNEGQFTLYIEDLLTSDTEGGGNGKILKGIPTFDAGEHDLKINGDLFVANQDGNNKVNILTILSGINGTILWTNLNPTSNFASQTINLNSSDYDILELIYMEFNSTNETGSVKIKKGYSTRLTTSLSSGTTYTRAFTYVSDTSYSIGNTTNGGNNSNLYPLYVIGYKTRLF